MSSGLASNLATDVPYVLTFIPEIAPAWLDSTATLAGFEPPSRAGPFAYCELGCGQGVTTAALAATHPNGAFHGIDAMAHHVAHAQGLCDAAAIQNLTLHTADFAAAADLDLPRFDYIVAHGVYSWIDDQSREHLRRFVDRRLRPGGLFYLSYNALPGWAGDAPFQFLTRALGATGAGDVAEKFARAMEMIQHFTVAGAPALKASFMATVGWERRRKVQPVGYFIHEFLASAWRPFYVTEVRAELAQIGLVPAGSATIQDNFDSFVLTRAAGDALAAVEPADTRELVRDYFLNQRFRRDVFVRAAPRLDEAERFRLLTETLFDLQRPAGLVTYGMFTEAGRVRFDNGAARAVVAGLTPGPRRLVEIPHAGIAAADLLANALALFAANEIRPVGPGSCDVAPLNRVLLDRLDAAQPIAYVALPCGTAVPAGRSMLRALRDGSSPPDVLRPWLDFFRRYEPSVDGTSAPWLRARSTGTPVVHEDVGVTGGSVNGLAQLDMPSTNFDQLYCEQDLDHLRGIAAAVEYLAGNLAAFDETDQTADKERFGISAALRELRLRIEILKEHCSRRRKVNLVSQLAELGLAEATCGLKLHVGSGETRLSGWINIDCTGADLAIDIRQGLPFADRSADAIFMCHALEHLYYPDEALGVLKELRRVLAPTGWLRIVVPDIEKCIRAYAAGDEQFFSERQKTWTWWPVMRTRLQSFLAYAGVGAAPGSFLASHKYGYDFETLADLLNQAGFHTIERSHFMQSQRPVLRVDEVSLVASATYGDKYYSLFVDAAR